MTDSTALEPIRRRRRWRFYSTPAGREPVRDFLYDPRLPDIDAANIVAAMKEVKGLGRAHPDVNHLKGDIWQIEIDGARVIYRLLFAEEARYGRFCLHLRSSARSGKRRRCRTYGWQKTGWRIGVSAAGARHAQGVREPLATTGDLISPEICMMWVCRRETIWMSSSPDGPR